MEKMKFLGFRKTAFTDDSGATEDQLMIPASSLAAMVPGATDKLELHFKDTNPQVAVSTGIARAVSQSRAVSRGSTGSVDNLAVGDLDTGLETTDTGNQTRDAITQSDMLVVTLSVIDEHMMSVMQTIAERINQMYNDDHKSYLMIWDIDAYGGTELSEVSPHITALDTVVMEDAVAATIT